jgi:hypothetical protein
LNSKTFVEDSMGPEDAHQSANELVPRMEELQRSRRVTELQGHDACADLHTALDFAQTLLLSRDRRGMFDSESESVSSMLRELRAMGAEQATPELVAMLLLLDAAVDQLADASMAGRQVAWEQLRKEVLSRHCSSPDIDC